MKILIFSPFAGIWRHTVLESQLIASLEQNKNFEITTVGCAGLFQTDCTVRSYFRGNQVASSELADTHCKKCQNLRHLFLNSTRAKSLNLVDFSDVQDQIEITNFFTNSTNQNCLDFNYRNVSIGQKALYEIILKYKKRTLSLDTEEYNEWANSVQNAARVIGPAEKILSIINPDVVITFNAQYAIPGTFAEIALMRGIKTYTISGSSSPVEAATAIRIWDWAKYKAEDPALYEWPGFENLKSPGRREIARYSRHQKYIETGKSPWTYSQGKMRKNPYDFFGINKTQKLVLATVNSEDENFAARIAGVFPPKRTESEVFSSQIVWIKFLISYYSKKSDTHLIIRLHPREFPNKRESRMSEQAEIWKDLLDSLPANVHLDHPDCKFSLYDYFNCISILTTGWSSTAIEALSYGIAVVTYDQKILGYPADVIYTGNSIEEYKQNLVLATMSSSTESKDRKKFAMKWTCYSLFQGAIYLGGGLQDLHLRTSNVLLRTIFKFINRILNTLIPNKIRKIDLHLPRNRGNESILVNFLLSKNDNLYQK